VIFCGKFEIETLVLAGYSEHKWLEMLVNAGVCKKLVVPGLTRDPASFAEPAIASLDAPFWP
jgi:hypothetical protein